LSNIKNLAKQTFWYGASSIAARLINYLLTPFLTYAAIVKPEDFGKMSLVYAAIPLLNVLFTYGFETAYFRFSSGVQDSRKIYSTASWSLIFTTLVFSALLFFLQHSLGILIGLEDFPKLIQLSIAIIAIDTLAVVPFAKLRQQGRPIKYAAIKISGILINVLLTWFFISYCPTHAAVNSKSWVLYFYNPSDNIIVYVVLANLVQSVITLLLLTKEIRAIKWEFDFTLWRQMMMYALPLIIAGMGGMINETFDRLMLRRWSIGDPVFKDTQVGIYNACYKLSILITLFIQAFRLGAEPFFFKQAEGKNPQRTYARVMKFFVIVITVMFLVVSLFMPIWKFFIGPRYWAGLSIVPILLLANMFLGIYYNLSVWYKLSNRTSAGALITLFGVGITCVVNYFFIPTYGFIACAWATFFCYGWMMVHSFLWGQKVYRIPYAWKKLLAYLIIVVIIYFIHGALTHLFPGLPFSILLAIILTFGYLWFVARIERKEFARMPFIGRLFQENQK
jgi:O-antigen/teichoic acid export membrane protein